MHKTLTVSFLYSLLAAIPVFAQQQDPFQTNVRPTNPLTPEQQQKSFQLPPGFEIQLFASEPEIAKPLNMAFDARGRLWITNTVEYPYPAPPDRRGRDSIKILEDTNGDGRADKISTFVDGLNIPIGLYPYKNGVIAFSIPHVWFFKDTDGDGKADKRTRLYGPFGVDRDTHGLNNSFRRGFDGWIYANHGFNNETTVQGTDGHVVRMQSGNTYRFRPDGSRIEQFTWGQVNPFGATFDELGNLFTADCHSKPIYQLLRGAYYPSFGKPHDGLGFVPPMMDHLHGSTAIAGVAQQTDSRFPAEFRGNMFSGNVMTSRVNRDSLIYHGSTILAREEPDFISTSDPWFRPVDVQIGPDGALYIADFYNRIIGHYEVPLDHPGRDRTSGRIWRVVYTGKDGKIAPSDLPDLTKLSVDELIAALGKENFTLRNLAADRIADHYGTAAVNPLRKAFRDSQNPRIRSRSLWGLFRLHAADEELLLQALNDSDRLVRMHALKALSETSEWSAATASAVRSGLGDEDAFVQRAAADALGLHPRHNSVAELLKALSRIPEEDNHLRHTIRMAIRNQLRSEENFQQLSKKDLSRQQTGEIASICIALNTPQAGSFLLDYIRQASVSRRELTGFLQHAARYVPAEQSDELARFAQRRFPDDPDLQLNLITAIQTGLQQRGEPAGETLIAWGKELAGKLLASLDDDALAWSNRPMAGMRFADNPWDFQNRPAADGKPNNRLLSSHPRGEQLTGILRSRTFVIPEKLSFYLAGHDGVPNRPKAGRNFVRLRHAETDALLAEVSPPRNDTAQKIEWDLKRHAGQRGYLELVDGFEGGAFAWLAAGRFEPAVVSVPKSLSPRAVSDRRISTARLAAALKLKHLEETFSGLLTDKRTEPDVRQAAAQAVIALEPNGTLAALLPLLGDSSISEKLRLQISRAFVEGNPELIRKLTADAFQTTPRRLQVVLAAGLAADKAGAETLLELIEKGQASPRLLTNPIVKARVSAAKPKDGESRIEKLTADLPSPSAEIQRLIATRRREFAGARTSLETGRQVYEKNCAVCHQLAGKGPLIGPQLDGIGNRGWERLAEDLLDPNRNVDVAFRVTTIVTTEGKVHTGLFRREEGAVLVFADNKGKEFRIGKSEIEEQKKSNLSLMPANVTEIISKQEFHHLLAFLLEQRAEPQPQAKSE